MGMSIPYEATGRTRQKAQTRSSLLDATRGLLIEGVTPTVEDAAARAGISRTTAYRYFPNQRSLLVASHPEIEKGSLLVSPAPRPLPAAALGRALLTEHILAFEAISFLLLAAIIGAIVIARKRDPGTVVPPRFTAAVPIVTPPAELREVPQ